MSTLIRVGPLVMTPKQMKRALEQDLTVSQTLKMIEDDKRLLSPSVRNVENDTTVTTRNGEDAEGQTGAHTDA